LDNASAKSDYYTEQYMNRSGENNKFSDFGGLLRDRPLPVEPWSSRFWRQINMAIDVLRAQRIGIDGFGVDIVQISAGRNSRIQQMLLEVSAQVAPNFRVMPEPDMGILRSVSADALAAYLTAFAKEPSSYQLSDGRFVVAPFWAEREDIGFWKAVADNMETRKVNIALLPIFLSPGHFARAFSSLSVGVSSWGARDPNAVDLRTALTHLYPSYDFPPIWMMPIAPQDVRPKNSSYWESQNSALFRHEWMQAILNGYKYVQLITWNDYSESTEISPSLEPQYVFYDLSAFYIEWFKSGRVPTITRDAIYFLHRRQIIDPNQTHSYPEAPMNSHGDPVRNEIEMLALLTGEAILQIRMGSRVREQVASAGLVSFKIPASPGRPVFSIIRHNRVVVQVRSDWEIQAHPDVEDPVYAGGSSTRRAIIDKPT
jgi:hypothetical protein